ncbi:MAG: inositol monophosphatase family protein [Methylotetracoccus sp.]
MDPMLNIATRAARAAGDVIMRSLGRVDPHKISPKGRNDFVSEVDRHAEREILYILQKAYPGHGFLAEEAGRLGTRNEEFVWVIDPLDGTTNFLHGFPMFAVSIGLLHRGRLEAGVIYDPVRQELFTAKRGGGATLENRRIRVAQQTVLAGALLGTGLPFKDQSFNDAYFGMLRELMKDTAGIRRAGSAALDLAYVAAGRLDGFWEIGLQPWDMAAGVLMIQEAGGIVSELGGGDRFLDSGNVVAANPRLHQAMLDVIAPHRTENLR